MTYLDFKRIECVVKLDNAVFKEIRDDKDALKQAIVVLYLSAIIASIWGIIASFGIFLVVILIVAPIGWLIWTGILHIIAKILGGKASFKGYLKVTGYSEAPMALGIIPIIGQLIGCIWSLACMVVATREAHEISTGKAVVVVLLPLAILLILAMLAVVFFVSMFNFARYY